MRAAQSKPPRMNSGHVTEFDLNGSRFRHYRARDSHGSFCETFFVDGNFCESKDDYAEILLDVAGPQAIRVLAAFIYRYTPELFRELHLNAPCSFELNDTRFECSFAGRSQPGSFMRINGRDVDDHEFRSRMLHEATGDVRSMLSLAIRKLSRDISPAARGTEMNKQIKDNAIAIQAHNAKRLDLSPLDFAARREHLLREGLSDLAACFGKKLKSLPYIDSRGEMSFFLQNSQRFGRRLAAMLNEIPVRTGEQPSSGHVLPENSWVRINHFDAEKLLIAAPELVDRPVYFASYIAPLTQPLSSEGSPRLHFDDNWLKDNHLVYVEMPDGKLTLAGNEAIALAERISPEYEQALRNRAHDIRDAIENGFTLADGVEDELRVLDDVLEAIQQVAPLYAGMEP